MADVKFSELSSLSAAASADVLAIVDSSESASKKLTIDNLFGAVPVNLAVTDVTQSTSNTTGSITTTGGIGVSKDAYVGGVLNVFGNTVLNGANTNIAGTTLTVDANVVIQSTLTVNSTTALVGTSLPLHFRDTGLSLSSPTNGTLDLAADTILEITAPTTNVIATTAVTVHTPAISANGTVTIGASADGYDVTFYGAAAGALMLWDESEDSLIVRGATADHATTSAGRIVLQTNQAAVADGDRIGQIDFQASNETGADALLVSASIWAEADDTFDATGNETELVFATGASETAAEQMRLTSDGKLGINIATPASLLDVRGTVQVGVDDTGHDVKFFGATSGAYMLWDEDVDDLILAGTAILSIDTTTDSSSTTTGSFHTDGGVGIAKKLYVGTDLDVDGTANLDAVDIDGAVQIDGTVTVGVDNTGYDVKLFGATSGKYWLWDEDADGVVQVGSTLHAGTLTVGVDDTGHDVKFFGASVGAFMIYDQSEDTLEIRGPSADATTSTGKLLLSTALTDINDGDVIGRIDFKAVVEAGGTDAILAGASIWAEADATFSSSVNSTDLVFATGDSDTATEDDFLKQLKKNRQRDSLLKSTQHGPHRDDLTIRLESRKARDYASEGQQRSMIISLKIAQLRFLHEASGILPVLLADDVLGELDKERKNNFWKAVGQEVQVIGSGTEVPSMDTRGKWQMFEVSGGEFFPQT
mgnify:CR=1 FL=1